MLEKQEALRCALAIPICAFPEQPGVTPSCYAMCYHYTYMDFMGENKLDTGSCTKQCERNGRKTGMLDRLFSTMN